MTSKAERQRRRARRRQINLAGGDCTEAPIRRRDSVPQPPADTVARVARARLLGGVTDANLAAAKSPLAGCAAGRALLAAEMAADRRSDLWNAVCHMRRVWASYGHAIGAPARHAKCLRILVPTEAMTTEGAVFDSRTQDERIRAAVSAYMAVQGWLGYVSAADRSACIVAVVDDAGLPNWPGIVRALECVSDGIKGKRPARRGNTTA